MESTEAKCTYGGSCYEYSDWSDQTFMRKAQNTSN